MLDLIAQTAGSGELAPWVGVGTTIGGSAFVAGIAWYLLTKQIPSMVEKHDKAIAAQREDFRKTLLDMQVAFERTLKDLTDKHDRSEAVRRVEVKASLDAILQHCERDRAQLANEVEAMALQNAQLTAAVEDLRADLRDWGIKKRPPKPPPPT